MPFVADEDWIAMVAIAPTPAPSSGDSPRRVIHASKLGSASSGAAAVPIILTAYAAGAKARAAMVW